MLSVLILFPNNTSDDQWDVNWMTGLEFLVLLFSYKATRVLNHMLCGWGHCPERTWVFWIPSFCTLSLKFLFKMSLYRFWCWIPLTNFQISNAKQCHPPPTPQTRILPPPCFMVGTVFSLLNWVLGFLRTLTQPSDPWRVNLLSSVTKHYSSTQQVL